MWKSCSSSESAMHCTYMTLFIFLFFSCGANRSDVYQLRRFDFK